MAIDKKELMRIMDFIIENNEVIMNKDDLFKEDLFNIHTLVKIRAIVRDKAQNNFELSEEQKESLVKVFIDNKGIFNENTPQFILTNESCIITSIKNNINSIVYIENISDRIKKIVINESIKQGYIIKENSPYFLSKNMEVVTNSIKLSCNSANHINWHSFNENEQKQLIDLSIEQGYVLNINSPSILKENRDIVLASIKKRIGSAGYASEKLYKDPEIFKYLMCNHFFGSIYLKRNIPISVLTDEEVLDYYLRKFDVYSNNNNSDSRVFNERTKKIVQTLLQDKPLIKNFDPIFSMMAEQEWVDHKRTNPDMYQNIFGKICSQLQNNENFNEATYQFDILKNITVILDKKVEEFNNGIKEYHRIYHDPNIEDKISTLEPLKDIISKCAALYISKSKDRYIKETAKNYLKIIEPFYELKLDNLAFKKKIIHARRRERFKELYCEKDKVICNKTKKLIEKYKDQFEGSNVDIERMLNLIIVFEYTEISNITKTPERYEEYIIFEETSKLINRLNSSYISFDGIEVKDHKHLIGYNEEKGKYYYSGREFSQEEVNSFNVYKKLSVIFDKLKKEVMIMTKDLQVSEEISNVELARIKKDIQFTDENYQFTLGSEFDTLSAGYLIDNCTFSANNCVQKNFIDEDTFNDILNLLFNGNILWLLLIMGTQDANDKYDKCVIISKLKANGIKINNIIKIINNMANIIEIAKESQIDISRVEKLMSIHELSEFASKSDIALLSRYVVERLLRDLGYTNGDKKEIIKRARDLVCGMAKRSRSTVPYVSGEYSNYNYSLYDPLDETILLSGLNTDACFRVCGNDNDFIHYCALDKNGFVIKITDCYGNFVARGSGFRHGNAVYINQLRTVYDAGGNGNRGIYEIEKRDIINTFKKACEDIVNTSQNNLGEEKKIDFAFVTQSYSLSNTDANVSIDVVRHIGNRPMDTESPDWGLFRKSTNNLREGNGGFTTDFGGYHLICMASTEEPRKIMQRNIKCEDVPALYERKRSSIIVQNKKDAVIIGKINKIKAMATYYSGLNYKEANIPEDSVIFMGDNWYIISYNDEIIDQCLLDFDNEAKKEFILTKMVIESNKHKEVVKEITEEETREGDDESRPLSKVLRLIRN